MGRRQANHSEGTPIDPPAKVGRSEAWRKIVRADQGSSRGPYAQQRARICRSILSKSLSPYGRGRVSGETSPHDNDQ